MILARATGRSLASLLNGSVLIKFCSGMQRRQGKGVAHISPPLPPSRMGSEISENPTSRLNQKSLGVTNRIWLILVLFLAVIFFTRSTLQSESSNYPRHKVFHTDAKPRNYLNITDGDSVPFSFCPALGPGDELATKYDPVALTKTRLHTGSGSRIQRVIMRALSGHPVTISVIGGSSESIYSLSLLSWHCSRRVPLGKFPHRRVGCPIYLIVYNNDA